MPQFTIAQMLQRTEDMFAQFTILGSQMDESARRLSELGMPPPTSLILAITDARDQLEELQKDTEELAAESGITQVDNNTPDSLVAIRDLLKEFARHQQLEQAAIERDKAIAVLDHLRDLRRIDQRPFAVLDRCISQAQTLRQEIDEVDLPNLHPAVDALVIGSHPLAALLTLAMEHATLGDDSVATLFEVVSQSYDITLAQAALRGRLVLDTGIEKKVHVEVPTSDSVETNPSNETNNTDSPNLQPDLDTPGTRKLQTDSKTAGEFFSSMKDAEQDEIPITKPEIALDNAENVASDIKNNVEDGDVSEIRTSHRSVDDMGKASEYGANSDPRQEQKDTEFVDDREAIALAEPVPEVAGDYGKTELTVNSKELGVPFELAPLSDPTELCTSQSIAQAILADHERDNGALLVRLVWQLIAEDQLALAYQLACYLEGSGQSWNTYPSPALIASAIAGRHICNDLGSQADLLRRNLAEINMGALTDDSGETNIAQSLLLAAATLRPTLVAPNTTARDYLAALLESRFPHRSGLDHLRAYCKTVVDYGKHRQPVNLELLGVIGERELWQKHIKDLQITVTEWLVTSQYKKVAYDAATKVWVHWVKQGGLIYQLLEPILKDEYNKEAEVRRQAQRLSDRNAVKREVNSTDRHLRATRTREIDYKSIDQIHNSVEYSVKLVQRWLKLLNSRPGTEQASSLLTDLRENCLTQAMAAQEELTALISSDNYPELGLAASATACRRSIVEIQDILEQRITMRDDDLDSRLLLHGILLADPEIEVGEDWNPKYTDEHLLYAVLRIAEQQPVNWNHAIEQRSASLDHVLTGRIIEYLRTCPAEGVDISKLEDRRKQHIGECRRQLEYLKTKTSRQVEGAVAYGLLRESERYEAISKIQKLETTAVHDLRFDIHMNDLSSIGRDIESKRQKQIEGVRQRLKANLDSEHADYTRIQQVLDAGDPLTANEYIDLIIAGGELPTDLSNDDNFATFFPKRMSEIEQYLEREFDAAKVVAGLRRYARGDLRNYQLGPVDMYHVSGPQANQSADLIQAWFSSKKQGGIKTDLIQQICAGLGLKSVEISVSRLKDKRTWADLSVEPIRDKTQCPVSQFGSGARGHYRLFCTWDRPSEVDLLNDIGETSHGAPVIVFYFNRLTQQRRRDLAAICRERRRTFIVIDDTLLIYLCGFRSPRLRVLFESTLPFTFLEPYTTTAGVVPPEMFYGRQRERDQILDPNGSCFIYGGRQLGKTALLRDIERNFHRPDAGSIVLWIDLKAVGIGYDRNIEELWQVIGREIRKWGIVPEKAHSRMSPETLLEHIYGWLEVDTKRTILLLLDEADRFLESDGKQEYQHASRIKGLMDRTNRRFKVVFAGLHNVQRTTRQENHPLAHYGTPICIGPLLENGEWREARALIDYPMTNLGYRFESPDLTTLILSQTNYYPSLIQLYGTQLIRKVTDPYRPVFDARNTPPYEITSKHVNEAYQSTELRNSIRQRFAWTLQLDQRYEVIAYAVALDALADDGTGLVKGYPLTWIREQALTWWPEGFQENNAIDLFETLADEMVGLGVLRPTVGKAYTLRSPNLLLLMGTQDDVETELTRAREPQLEYEPATFRTAYREDGSQQTAELTRRSPLTAQQESDLRGRNNGVSIIFGNEAAGLKDLDPFLKLAFGPESFHVIGSTPTWESLKERLDYVRGLERRGTTLVVVPYHSGWNGDWVLETAKYTASLRTTSNFLRVVYVADSRQTWELIKDERTPFDKLSSSAVSFVTLRPWHDAALRQWLDDCNLEPREPDGRRAVTEMTGNWPTLLQRFYEITQPNPHEWKAALETLDKELTNALNVPKLLRQLGLFHPDQQRILADMSILEEVSVGELAACLAEEVSSELVWYTCQWADLMGLIWPKRDGKWSVHPLVGRLLSAEQEHTT